MIRTVVFAAVLLATAACAESPAPSGPPPPGPAPPTQVSEATPQPAPASAPAPSGQCDAASLAWLVGHPRSDIPVPVDPSHRRVYCSSCIITEDYWPQRTDIVYDSRTGIVLSVRCG